MQIKLDTRIYVAGHNGMLGSAIVRLLKKIGYANIITRSHKELDLLNQDATRKFLEAEKPDLVYLTAAMVGGIHANNTYPADFIYSNLMIQANVIHQSWCAGIKKLLFIGSSCSYPSLANQPIKEEALLTGSLERTSEPYAIAKITGIKMCESYNRQYGNSHGTDYRSVIPATLYGPGDNYNLENSHVIPALIRRYHEAKIRNMQSVIIWGSGMPLREFLYVDDMAKICVFIMNLSDNEYYLKIRKNISQINIGSGSEISISELARKISEIVGFNGETIFDNSKSDGAPRKFLNSEQLERFSKFNFINLENGLELSYKDYLKRYQK